MKRFKGFTLAELMVALAVIGIIVAVVTPAIVKTRPNKNKMMVKKTYYTVENIVSKLINDEKLYPDKRDFCYLDESDSEHGMCRWGFDDWEAASYEGESYLGPLKFPLLFKDHLNVSKDVDKCTLVGETTKPGGICPKFYTTDGVLWDISDTYQAWISKPNKKVGTFKENIDDSTHKDTPGIGKITIDVNGDEEPNAVCNADNEDCDQYEIQILANGKMRINPDHTRAIDYVTINTSIKDSQ